MKNKNTSEHSKCCGAKVKIVGKTTMHYECRKCGEACDIYFKIRKTWKINPTTKIKKDKRPKFEIKLTKKEIDEIRRSEDF